MGTCTEKTCARPATIRKMCDMHYRTWSFTDEGRRVLIEDPRIGGRPLLEGVGYSAVHYRVKRVKGLASDHACVDCAGVAGGWSLKHDADIVVDKRGVTAGKLFSLNADDYEPRCDNCHRAYDMKHGLMREGLPEDFIKTFRPETEAKAEVIVDMIQSGMSANEVAAALSLNRSTVVRFFAQQEGMSIKEWRKSQLN